MFPMFPKCSSFLAPAKDSTIHFGNIGNVRPRFHRAGYRGPDRRGRGVEKNILERYGIFRSIAEQSVDALVCGDHRGKIIFFNAAAERLFGYRQEEILGRAITNLMPARYRKAHREGFRRVVSGGETRLVGKTVEFAALRKDGSEFPVEFSLSASGTREGAVFTTLIRDITERKRGEKELFGAREYLEKVLNSVVDGVIIVDMDRRIMDCNLSVKRVFGYEKEELTGKSSRILFPGREQYEAAGRTLRRGIIKKGYTEGEIELRHKSGKVFPARISGSAFYDEAGKQSGIVGTVTDFTERKVAEQEITQLAGRNESLLDSAGQGIYGVDRDGRITFVNPAGAEMLGYAAEELMGRSSHALFHHTRPDGEPYPESECPIFQAYRKKTVLRVTDEIFFRKDGGAIPVEYTVNSLRANGDAAGAVVVFDDITERLRAEAELMTVNRAMKALSQCNERLVRAVDERKLLHEICAIMVDTGGYDMAWAGYAVAGAKVAIRPVAFAGESREFFQKLPGIWKVTENREGPVRKAIRSGEAVLIRDLAHDRRHIPWKEEALRHGFAALAAYPLRVHGQAQGLICIYSGTAGAFDAREAELLVELADDLAFGLENIRTRKARDRAEEKSKESLERLKLTVDGTTQALAMAAEARDPYTAGHQRRVAALACAMAEEMDLDSEVIDCLHVAGMLHDVGKISIPAEILTKPGALSKLEMNMVKEHAEASFNILSQVKFPWPVARIVRQHHERLDGTGYPLELTGSDILTEARILAIADTVEAMTSHRPYRPGLGLREALAEIERGRGSHFDPEAVDACLRLFADKRFEFEKAA